MIVFFHPLLLRIILVSKCKPLQITITENNKLILNIETPIELNNDDLRLKMITAIGRDFFLHTVSNLENDKIQIILMERDKPTQIFKFVNVALHPSQGINN